MDGLVGLIFILAVVAYAYNIDLDRALFYAVATGLAVLGIILAIAVWKWWIARKKRFWTDPTVDVNAMTGLEFERYVAALLEKQGYTGVKLTEYYDYGVDIIARKDGATWGIQAKRHNGLVKAAAVRQVYTALAHYKCDRAMVISNSTYSRPAQSLAHSTKTVLVGREQLSKWISETQK